MNHAEASRVTRLPGCGLHCLVSHPSLQRRQTKWHKEAEAYSASGLLAHRTRAVAYCATYPLRAMQALMTAVSLEDREATPVAQGMTPSPGT